MVNFIVNSWQENHGKGISGKIYFNRLNLNLNWNKQKHRKDAL
jgi:hypothetical protein